MYKTINCLMADEFSEFPGNSYEREIMICCENFYVKPEISTIISTWEREYGEIEEDIKSELRKSLKKILKNDKIYNYLNLRWLFKNPSVHFYCIKNGRFYTIAYIEPGKNALLRLTPHEFSFSGYKRFSKKEFETYRFRSQYFCSLFEHFMSLLNIDENFSPCRKSLIMY